MLRLWSKKMMALTLAILCFLAMTIAVAAFVVCVDAADQQE
jgi:hypothetical protein